MNDYVLYGAIWKGEFNKTAFFTDIQVITQIILI